MNLGPDCTELPFEILAQGRFNPQSVRVRHDPSVRPTTPELEAAIHAEWEKQVAFARRTNRMLFNGELLRYVGHVMRGNCENRGTPITDETFELTVGPTCYRDFVGTNLFGGRFLKQFGWNMFSNAVGTTATVLTVDNRICYGRRSSRVSYHAGYVHTFGGALEAADRWADGSIDAFASVARELKEELGLERGELVHFECVGMIRDKEIHQPEMLFEATLDLTADELYRRWQDAESKDEHEDVVSLANEPEAIVPFIKSCGLIAPVAIGALLLHGRLSWGDDWFRQASSQMRPAAWQE